MDKLTEKIKRRYDRASKVYDLFEKPMELHGLGKWRKEFLKELKGKVLEVGVGTGKNIEYYPIDAEITAIDFSPKMLEKAKLKAEKLNSKAKLMVMDAQNMDFEDNTFDMVFASCVFCSVPNPVKGLMEIRRVCKPQGKIILLEHVRSEKAVLGTLMDLFNPLVVSTYGANINRRTLENAKVAGFDSIRSADLWMDIVKKIDIINSK